MLPWAFRLHRDPITQCSSHQVSPNTLLFSVKALPFEDMVAMTTFSASQPQPSPNPPWCKCYYYPEEEVGLFADGIPVNDSQNGNSALPSFHLLFVLWTWCYWWHLNVVHANLHQRFCFFFSTLFNKHSLRPSAVVVFKTRLKNHHFRLCRPFHSFIILRMYNVVGD